MYCGNTIANGFGGMLAAGILSGLDGASGLAGWRYVTSILFSDSFSCAQPLMIKLFTQMAVYH
jgi:hypothetical protein